MHSVRFDLPVVFTEHAKLRMVERNMDATLVLDIIDTGTSKTQATPTIGCTDTSMTAPTICYV